MAHMAKKKLGRPQKDDDDKAGKPFPVRLTDDQKAVISTAAELEGFRDLSPWIRKVLVEAATRIIKKHAKGQ
jgi:uncharacterized protein (DUF1778 family)